MRAVHTFLVIGILFAGLLGGCTQAAQVDPADLVGPAWLAESYGTPQGLAQAEPGVVSSIVFEDGQAGGSGGVNSYSATYEAASDGSISFGPVGSTKMAGPPEAMQQEAALYSALESAASFEIVDGQLILADENGDTLVVFTAE